MRHAIIIFISLFILTSLESDSFLLEFSVKVIALAVLGVTAIRMAQKEKINYNDETYGK